MDRELAGAVIERWEAGLPISEKSLFKAASALGIDPEVALVEARYYTYLDSYLLEKRAMSAMERIVFSGCAGINPFSMEKTAGAYGFSPDELILAALEERGFVPDLEKLANLPMIGGPPTTEGQGPPDMGDPAQQQAMQQAMGIMGAPPQQQAMLQQQPQARGFKPSAMAPEQMPSTPGGNLQDLLQDQQGVFGQGAVDNGGLPAAGMPEPPPPPPSSEERIQQVGPTLDPETVSRYGDQLSRFEEGIQMQVSDPKQMVKFVKELQKVDNKRIDQGIKAMGQQLEQEQAAEFGVDGAPTIDGPAQGAQVLAPKPGGNPADQGAAAPAQAGQQATPKPPPKAAMPPGAPQQPKPQRQLPGAPQAPGTAAEKVAHAARAIARAHSR